MTAVRLKAEDIRIFSDAASAFFQATTGSKASVRTPTCWPRTNWPCGTISRA
jgi:hypothetical protein